MNTTAPAQGTTPLLPCPFHEAAYYPPQLQVIYNDAPPDSILRYMIYCFDCRARGPVMDTEGEAAAAWNQRAPDADRQRLIAEAEKLRERIAELERALGEAWEPVPSEYEIVEENGDCLNIEDGTISTSRPDTDAERYARFWFTLPDNIRLCRRTSSSPTAEGE